MMKKLILEKKNSKNFDMMYTHFNIFLEVRKNIKNPKKNFQYFFLKFSF